MNQPTNNCTNELQNVRVRVVCMPQSTPCFLLSWVLFRFVLESHNAFSQISNTFVLSRKLISTHCSETVARPIRAWVPSFWPQSIRNQLTNAAVVLATGTPPLIPLSFEAITDPNQPPLHRLLPETLHHALVARLIGGRQANTTFSAFCKDYFMGPQGDNADALPGQVRDIWSDWSDLLLRFLHVEIAQMAVDVRTYDLFYTTLSVLPPSSQPVRFLKGQLPKKREDPLFLFRIAVPGVGQRQPAVLVGDLVFLMPAHLAEMGQYCVGIVHIVEEASVVVEVRLMYTMVAHPLHDNRGKGARRSIGETKEKFHIRFTVDARPFSLMLNMLTTPSRMNRFICNQSNSINDASSNTASTNDDSSVCDNDSSLLLSYAGKLVSLDDNFESLGKQALDDEQRLAVQRILATPSNNISQPFVLSGPAGTGKTATIIEAMLQAYELSGGKATFLVCAPSDVACDVLAERLADHLTPAQLLRVNAPFRHTAMSPRLTKYSKTDPATGRYALPPLPELMQTSFVVTTCFIAGQLYRASHALQLRGFRFVIIDEASQALESEAMLAAELASPDSGVVVLCGDHRQLGPVIHSQVNCSMLCGSWQQRLLSTPIYATDGPLMCTLTRCFRMVPELVELASRLFYNDRLVAVPQPKNDFFSRILKELKVSLEGGVAVGSIPLNDEDGEEGGGLQEGKGKDGEPALLFFGVVGGEGMPEDLLSHANIMEVEQVVRVVRLLTDSHVSTAAISVISPFRKQISVLRAGLRAVGLGAVRVGAVVDFQGQESDIVVVSTVICRASEPGVMSGLLRDPNQFNVTITRPKSMLVVVGNPFVLAQDDHWKALLQHAMSKDAYTGVPFSVGSETVDLMTGLPRFQDDEDIVWRLF